MNLMIAIGFSVMLHENPCVWYWINLMLETTVGVFIAYLFITGIQAVAEAYHLDFLRTGNYIS
jgi:hypothetical protein